MKIILCGSQEIGVKTLELLLDLNQEVPLVLTYKPESYERWKFDLGKEAVKRGIPVEYTRKVEKEPFFTKFKDIQPDWLLLVGWRDMIPEEIYSIPTYGAANLHQSCLPEGRGFSPFNWPIILGMEFTGVSIFKLSKGIDTGPVLGQKTGISINPRETYGSLVEKLVQPSLDLIKDVVLKLDSGKPQPEVPCQNKESFFARRVPQDSEIDWNRSAIEIDRLVRASHPAPLAYTYLRTQRDTVHKIYIHETQLPPWDESLKEADSDIIHGVAGNWLGANDEGVAFLTGKGDRILIKKISLESDRDRIIPAVEYKQLKSITSRLGRKYLLMD